jgi:disulfide bond formation protein DsbB
MSLRQYYHSLKLYPERVFGGIFLLCVVLLGTGFVLQYVYGLTPCPLCILQRFFFAAAGLTALAGAWQRPQTKGVRRYALLLVAWAVLGGVVAARQVWLEHHPPESLLGTSCAPWLGSLNDVIVSVFQATADCAERTWTLLGLSIPEWSLLAFLFLVLAGVVQWKCAAYPAQEKV